jgi:tricorn protease-like protein
MKATHALLLVALAGCSATATPASGTGPQASSVACFASQGPSAPIAGALPADALIQPDERHFAHLWQLTRGGNNAEGYFDFTGTKLSFQRTNPAEGLPCDQIFVLGEPAAKAQLVSTGRGVTTCAYYLPDGRHVLFASTHGHLQDCPPPLDHSQGYAWAVRPEFDLYVRDLDTGALSQLTYLWGYDAECTVSPLGDRLVFTSTRSGDLELWSAKLDGTDLRQLTHELGYDGGAFYSHDGTKLVFRSTLFDADRLEEQQAQYKELLMEWKVRPQSMEIQIIDADGSNRRQVTHLGGANFAPYFFVGDARIVFASNHHERAARNFDLFAIDVDGENLERLTTYPGFDAFPMFDPSGRYFVFASNRGGAEPGETNLFLAAWKD